jgi:benzoate membrane transport protein
MLRSETLQRWLPALGTAIPLIIFPIAVLSLPLAAAQEMRLSAPETTSWILVVYGLPGLWGLVLTIRYRQPLLLTGNIFVLIFIASLGGRLSYPELVGASIVAGASIVLLSALGLTGRLAAWIPAPIVLGLLAGAVMPFVSDIFTSLGEEPALVGGIVLAYFLSRRVLGSRLPAILPALIAGLAIAALDGEFGQVPARLSLPIPTVTNPDFSVHAIATVTGGIDGRVTSASGILQVLS